MGAAGAPDALGALGILEALLMRFFSVLVLCIDRDIGLRVGRLCDDNDVVHSCSSVELDTRCDDPHRLRHLNPPTRSKAQSCFNNLPRHLLGPS